MEDTIPLSPPSSLLPYVLRLVHVLPGMFTSNIQISFFMPTYNFWPVGSNVTLRAATTSSTKS